MRFLLYAFLFCVIAGATSPEPTLINGNTADPRDWPASVYASMGSASCSATVVGERTLFIAAHCVKNVSTARFSVLANSYSSQCTISPDYKKNDTADLALCLINRAVTGIEYEKVNLDPTMLAVGREITLTGYGCITTKRSGGNDGTYRVGQATIQSLPTSSSNNLTTKGGAILCSGDSGGPAFVYPKTDDRYLVSVNSAVAIGKDGTIQSTSYLTSTSTTASIRFIQDWASKNNQAICGVDPNAIGCRQTADVPANSFQLENRLLTLNAKMKAGNEKHLPDVKEALDWVLRTLSLNLSP